MTISLKADAGGAFGEILVNGSQVAKFTPGGNAVIPGAVGTVSQSGGIPTGAIIERGSNANGEFVRFSDGTQICFIAVAPSAAIDQAFFGGFRTVIIPLTYPATFAAGPTISAAPAGFTAFGCSFASVTVSFAELVFTSVNSQLGIGRVAFILVIGRWF